MGPATRCPLQAYRRLCLATVTTHDLPPTRGYLEGIHVDIRHRLGLLTRSLEEERATDAAEQRHVVEALRARGLLDLDETDPAEVVLALHRFLGQTPSLMLGVAVRIWSGTGDRSTSQAPTRSTPTGGSRCPTRPASRCSWRTSSSPGYAHAVVRSGQG